MKALFKKFKRLFIKPKIKPVYLHILSDDIDDWEDFVDE